jgi:hypothetical protein
MEFFAHAKVEFAGIGLVGREESSFNQGGGDFDSPNVLCSVYCSATN